MCLLKQSSLEVFRQIIYYYYYMYLYLYLWFLYCTIYIHKDLKMFSGLMDTNLRGVGMGYWNSIRPG